MDVFSSDHRSDYRPRLYSEPLFSCLDRRAGPQYDAIRAEIDRWLQNYPIKFVPDLLSRFRTGEDWQFHSAFLELYVHELLRLLSLKVTVHPQLAQTSKQPDFLATSGTDDVVYLECVAVTETSAAERWSLRLLGTLYDTIDKVTCLDYFLALNVSGTPGTPVPGRKWRVEIQRWVDSLNYDQIVGLGQQGRCDEFPSLELCHDGLVVRLEPIAKKGTRGKPAVRPIGAVGGDAEWVTSRIAIADALKGKATRYGQLRHPYIVVVNCLGEMCDLEEIREAIYGTDGLWPIRKAEFTRVSAVIALYHLLPWSVPRADICLFPNPHAKYSYCGPLTQLPQQIGAASGIDRLDGINPSDLFGLSSKWPQAADDATT